MPRVRLHSTSSTCVTIPKSQMSEGQFKEAVRKKAAELYEASGRKRGRDLDNWLEAERIIKTQMHAEIKHIQC